MLKKMLSIASGLLLVGAAGAQTVTVSLTSPQNGLTISPGSTVTWTIAFTVSTGSNQGLALLAADLVPDEDNPAVISLVPAAVPGGMTNFSRPAGISNPGESNPATGYGGVLRGGSLVQIGGGQNTFGVAQPGGTGIAESANVTSGVGQSGSVTLATGTFVAPTTQGSYSLALANVVANTIVQRNNAPAFSPVSRATTSLTSGGAITFTVGAGGCPHPDVRCDHSDIFPSGTGDCNVNLSDLGVVLSNFAPGVGGKTRAQGDVFPLGTGDGFVDLSDLGQVLSDFGADCR